MKSLRKFAVATAFAFALGGGAVAQDKLKVAFIYVGPVSDHGWSFQHNQGRLAVEKELGDKVETTFVESVAEGPDTERVLRQLAEQGNKLIFTTSFGYMNSTVKIAKQFPDVKFEHATGYKRADNVATYSSRFYEGRYVIGQIAGKMSKTGTVGYVASFPIPEVIQGINAFMLGMQSVRPDAKIKVIWVSTWYDPAKEADAARALLDQGADIITQHTDSPAPLQGAEQRSAFAFGQASDMIKFAPKAQLTAIVDNWSDYYISRVKAVLDGTWKSEDTWGGIGANMVVLAPFTNMPDDVKQMAMETEKKIASGEFHPFQGPLFNQAGEQVIPEGERLTDEAILGMNWYVKGMEDKIPQ